ncbi:MAG: hypothetical protein NC037_06355 [Bacteroides sp.]|nr:hypothetical protein [Bacillota bacterium]MCM1393614.1 hypothetical protein [[Eubacterium] siraeum]MCM1456126.1 hypothetical protein [Bacteroides sp.]
MNRKPIILIMTSKDEVDDISHKLANAIQIIGTHNAVVMSDDKYGSATRRSALDRLMDSGAEYQYILERKDRSAIKKNAVPRKFSKRVDRIKNMLKRFRPEYILCVTPYAHHCACEAKRKLRFNTQILYIVPTFTAPKRGLADDVTNTYIVENPDIKAELVRTGIRSKDIMTMGFPFEIYKKTEEEIAYDKQELGLPRAQTIFVHISNAQMLENVLELLIDQGDLASIAVYCTNPKLIQKLGNLLIGYPEVTVLFVQASEKIDEYLSVCDLAITDYDTSIIYKCFKLEIPSIIYTKDEHVLNDVNYLVNHGLCVRAKEDIDVIELEYKLLQTEYANEIGENGAKWTEFNTLENIANFLVSYIAV